MAIAPGYVNASRYSIFNISKYICSFLLVEKKRLTRVRPKRKMTNKMTILMQLYRIVVLSCYQVAVVCRDTPLAVGHDNIDDIHTLILID
mmetsp:Transcript_13908/g.29408  ORF Transcript_13908/g.29408 Transcript_13908/m.29408 type:complete len:90 (-) Transcript_13908:367-636(-)